jgi:predicted RNase H-like HicB family nuclease
LSHPATAIENALHTRFTVGLEESAGRAVYAHGLNLPGCIGVGATSDEALEAFERDLNDWLAFLEAHGMAVPPRGEELDIVVEEWIEEEGDVEGSRACFEADRVPLGPGEVARALDTLGALRGRLLPRIRRARDADLEGHRTAGFTAREVLEELARAQWWTLTRLGASPLAAVPDRVVARLDTAMALVVDRFSTLDADRSGMSIVLDGEEWTPRKVLRSILWLEWSLGGAALRTLDADTT